ncbi:hypothetical protein C8R47DRAFT_1158984 [Mycena vitilis]|nr:hypothetical protein C8R47DRAFT_1158984 [Mycena vitilis]
MRLRHLRAVTQTSVMLLAMHSALIRGIEFWLASTRLLGVLTMYGYILWPLVDLSPKLMVQLADFIPPPGVRLLIHGQQCQDLYSACP